MSAAALFPVLAFLERLTLLVGGVGECIAGRPEWQRLSQPLHQAALQRVQLLLLRIRRSLRVAASGRVSPPPPLPPSARARDDATLSRTKRPADAVPLPRGMGWLTRLAPGAEIYGAALADLLAEPDFAPLFPHAPGARRSLRALCIALGLTPPPPVQKPPAARPAPSGEEDRPGDREAVPDEREALPAVAPVAAADPAPGGGGAGAGFVPSALQREGPDSVYWASRDGPDAGEVAAIERAKLNLLVFFRR